MRKRDGAVDVYEIELPGDPLWLKLALRDLGVAEIPGKPAHPRIEEYHRHGVDGMPDVSDEIPWCASAVSCWLDEAGIRSARTRRALNYMKWGATIVGPVRGAVAVFDWRNGAGHVGFALGMDRAEDGSRRVVVVGGNQGDRVSVARFSTRHLAGYRWPA